MDQLDGISIAGIFDRAIVEGEAISLVDLEHRIAAAGEGVSPQIQLFAADLIGHHQRGPGLYPAAETGGLVPALTQTGNAVVDEGLIDARTVFSVAAQGAGSHVLLRAILLRIAPLVRRAAGEGHGGNAPPVRPNLRIAAGFHALDLVVAAPRLVPCDHIGKRRVLARRRQCAPQEPDRSQIPAGKGSAAIVCDGHFPGAAALAVAAAPTSST